MKKTIYIFVKMFCGLIQDVQIFFNEKYAIENFEMHTGVLYEEYMDKCFEWSGDKKEAYIFEKEINISIE